MHTKSNNVVLLRGQLSSDPRPRQLPSGDEVINYEVTTETDEGKASVPVAWFAPRRRPNLQAGDEVLVAGFVRRRFFWAGGSAGSKTEVVAEVVARPTTRTAAAAVARMVARLEEPGYFGGEAAAGVHHS